ncbi:MAG: polysaccharide biosynthesis protein [Candidatus Staskawiczbacteria bacterium]|nr:polysaccharide biosynthesis protein [Candidatus Staskawiczbacteria bacterium]
MLADVIFITLSVWLAFLFRFDADIPHQYFPFIWRMVELAIIFTIPVFYFNKLYSFSWSYVSASEAISLFRATTISFLFLGITIFLSNYFPRFINFPRSTIFITYILVFILCGGLRFSKRVYLHTKGFKKTLNKEKTLIAGAGDAGEQILRSILSSRNNPYLPVGFVDDNPLKKNISIHGFRVLGEISDISKIILKHQIKQLIVALPTAGVKTIANAVDLGRKAGLKKIKIAPHINEIISGAVSFKDLKTVEAESLLGRERVDVDFRQIENFIKNKAILITGASGSIGSELSRLSSKFNPSRLMLLDQDETGIFNISEELKEKFPNLKIFYFVCDIFDGKRINDIFSKFRPEIVFHAAAYKHVPLMEQNPTEAVKNNIFGTKSLVEGSLASGTERFIFISTDKAVNPTSVMGATKRVGEMICQAKNQDNKTKFISVRFGNVLDSRGSVIPKFREQIRKRGPVEVTHPDMKRYFMLISEACLLVMQSSAMGKGGEVFVLDMGKPVKIVDLAKEMIRLSGFEPDKDIPIVFTGIRPGEKLFEEILTAEEGTFATQNQKIFMAKLSDVNLKDLEEKLKELKDAADSAKKENLMECLKKLVPYYKPGG